MLPVANTPPWHRRLDLFPPQIQSFLDLVVGDDGFTCHSLEMQCQLFGFQRLPHAAQGIPSKTVHTVVLCLDRFQSAPQRILGWLSLPICSIENATIVATWHGPYDLLEQLLPVCECVCVSVCLAGPWAVCAVPALLVLKSVGVENLESL